jgi:hypothetical protein
MISQCGPRAAAAATPAVRSTPSLLPFRARQRLRLRLRSPPLGAGALGESAHED